MRRQFQRHFLIVALLAMPGTPAVEPVSSPRETSVATEEVSVPVHFDRPLPFPQKPRKPAPTSLPLAGRTLDRYPFFEFLRAFEEGESIAIAIDPGHLDGAARTCDVYMVAARTDDEWNADPALVDVRGAPQTEMFSGGVIQANTFTLTGSEALSGDAGASLGVGYDIVADCNRNGYLDPSDFIDGLGDEAGLYVVRDPTLPGPFAVSSQSYSVPPGSVPPGFEPQRVYFPTGITSLGEQPLVVICHGNGHQYTWYDYLGNHLASYGYVVMSLSNNTGPGIESSSTTIYQHTDAFLGNLSAIAGGVLERYVDGNRIAWIGHSRGGEGVVRAYQRLRTGLVTTEHYTAEDILVISGLAPTNSLGPELSEPGTVNYHTLWGAADGDVSGSGFHLVTWSFPIFERADGFRHSTYVHGADHNDFNCCGVNDFAGPAGTAIGRAEAQRVAKAVYLVLVERYLEGNVAAQDYLWRQSERFRPDGIAPTTVLVNDYREALDAISFVIDDFQTAPNTAVSSSGGAVTFTIANVIEGQMRDDLNDYDWLGSEPMNGMSRANSGDVARGVVFDWGTQSENPQAFFEFEIIPAERDFSDDVYLTFRACQGTRHPETTPELGDLTFTVTLRDASGTTSSIDIGAYGGGIEEVYHRDGGWQNEFEVVRVRLDAFLHNGSGLDLTNIEAVRFEFGATFGSARGRLGLDDIALSIDASPPPPGSVVISLPDGALAVVPPGEPTSFRVRITQNNESLVSGSAILHHRSDGGTFQSAPLVHLGGDLFEATLPQPACGEIPEFFLSARGSRSGSVVLPRNAPNDVLAAIVGVSTVTFADDFETHTGWTAENLGASSGAWSRGVPVDDPDWPWDPESDFDGSGRCALSDNRLGNTDVDGGEVRLTSPVFDMSSGRAVIEYAYYLRLSYPSGLDRFVVEVSEDNGSRWTTITGHDTDGHSDSDWTLYRIGTDDLVAAGVVPTSTMRIRFTVGDGEPQSIVEAGLDAFTVTSIECE